jgi:hypothetical protein
LKVGSGLLDEKLVERVGASAAGLIEAEQKSSDRLGRLERERKILEEEKKIRDLRKEIEQ